MPIYQNPYEITLTSKEFRSYAERRKIVIEIPREELNIHDCVKIHLQNSENEILFTIEPHSDASVGSAEDALTKSFVKINEVRRNF